MKVVWSGMAKTRCVKWWGWKVAGLLAGMTLAFGCHAKRQAEPVSIASDMPGPMTIAVAPALNLSGSADFDPNRFADLMASELSYADRVSVIPVSRVLAALAAQGHDRVESPTHALELVGLLGADALLVFAVTEYDPYDPPSIGISAQLYGAWTGPGNESPDPVALSRQSQLTASGASAAARRLLAQTQRVFDASHGAVVADVQKFARMRGGDDSPYGWRKYVVSQQLYIRYCCHATIRALLSSQSEPVPADVGREK